MRHMNDIMAIIIANRKGREHTGSEKRRECVDRVSSIGSSSLYSSLVSSMLPMMPSSWGWGVWPFDSRSYDMILLLLFFERNTRRPDLSEGNWPEPRDCEFIVIAGAYYRPVLFCLQLSHRAYFGTKGIPYNWESIIIATLRVWTWPNLTTCVWVS